MVLQFFSYSTFYFIKYFSIFIISIKLFFESRKISENKNYLTIYVWWFILSVMICTVWKYFLLQRAFVKTLKIRCLKWQRTGHVRKRKVRKKIGESCFLSMATATMTLFIYWKPKYFNPPYFSCTPWTYSILYSSIYCSTIFIIINKRATNISRD